MFSAWQDNTLLYFVSKPPLCMSAPRNVSSHLQPVTHVKTEQNAGLTIDIVLPEHIKRKLFERLCVLWNTLTTSHIHSAFFLHGSSQP